MLAQAKTPSALSRGNHVIVYGLCVQLVFFGLFIVNIIVYHCRLIRHPTARSVSLSPSTNGWRRMLLVLYITSTLILIRSVFRLIEFVQGSGGVLQSMEVYLYVFDSALMLIVMLIFNAKHPGNIVTKKMLMELDSEGDGEEK